MKILYIFEEVVPKEHNFLSKLCVFDPISSSEEVSFWIKNDEHPKIHFENDNNKKEFQRTFKNEYIIIQPEIIISGGKKFKTVSSYISSIIPKLIKEFNGENLSQSA